MLILFMLLVSQFILGMLIYPAHLNLRFLDILRLVASFALMANVGEILWRMIFE